MPPNTLHQALLPLLRGTWHFPCTFTPHSQSTYCVQARVKALGVR